MELFDWLKNEAIELYNVFIESPEAGMILGSIFAVLSVACLRSIVAALLEMHRSRSRLKKLLNSYNFGQKLIMIPAWQECLHAKKFCKAIIVAHHIRVILFLLWCLLLLASSIHSVLLAFCASCSGILFLLFDFPVLIMHWVMDRYPFQRLKHEYRFQKYHNTNNHDSLF